MNIFNSATRLVLLITIASLVIMTMFVVFKNSQDQSVITALVGLFSNVAVAITSFYFGQKSPEKIEANAKP